MKVLLIWEEIPDSTKLYSLEGELAELAIKSAGHHIGVTKDCSALDKLNDQLETLEPIGDGGTHLAFNISGHDKVVICGFVM